MTNVAFAIGAHPDDIESMMAGTLLRLGRAGWELHTMNVANGSQGTATYTREEIIAIRGEEAREAARTLGATLHPPIADDLEILYDMKLVAKICSVVRRVRPAILLLPSPQDYMEDHTNASRLAVTAAFCRGMRNFPGDPPAAPALHDMALYHALPWGLRDQLRGAIRPEFYVDIGPVLEQKSRAMACHISQREWLDQSQGPGSYVAGMTGLAAEVGRWSGRFEYAEGWRRHSHLGFGPEEYDPLSDALRDSIVHRT